MAQPFFDEHPLQEYFRQTGETAEPMPGGSTHFELEAAVPEAGSPTHVQAALDNLPPLLVQAIYFLSTFLSSSKFPSIQNAFAERFKYDVISSSLLSTSIASSQPTPLLPKRLSLTPQIPGDLLDHFPDGPSTGDSTPNPPGGHSFQSQPTPESPGMTWPISILSIAVLVLSAEYYFLALFLFAVSAYLVRTAKAQASRAEAMNLTVKTLDELISAGTSWDTVVNEAMNLIEQEERRQAVPNSFYGPTSPQSPFSPLRVAIQSSLLTTQTQCDNVRHLLAALTSPTQLAQLSEMYAPASPIRPPFLQLDHPNISRIGQHSRPLSDPVTMWRRRTSSESSSSTKASKRSTWNGSYLSQAGYATTPTTLTRQAPSSVEQRKADRRRSELSSLFTPPRSRVSSISAPPSPQHPQALSDVQEEAERGLELQEEEDMEEEIAELPALKEKGYFGMAALDLRRKRRSMGMDVFRLPAVPLSPPPPPRYTPPSPTPRSTYSTPSRHHYQQHQPQQPSGSLSPPPTLTSSTRFTLPHLSRHPLSLSALRLALQGALASKRYACSHLLALRFDEEEGEDESYWEDVRSVMSLLVGAIGDASGRLKDALSDSLKRKDRDATISPTRSGMEDKGHTDDKHGVDIKGLSLDGTRVRSMAEMVSFAPVPSHLTRFAAHVDAISTALNDARSQLEGCVAAIRDTTPSGSSTSSAPTSPTLTDSAAVTPSSSSNMTTPTPNSRYQHQHTGVGLEASAALQAYDRLRKELGFALRECERGRDRLIDILNPPRPPNPEPEDLSDDLGDRDSMATPPLVPDTSSDSSSRIGSANLSLRGSLGLDLSVVETMGGDDDDVTEHLLLGTMSEGLPPMGAEQVYEADSELGGGFRRERSVLTREERIKLVKARRESAKGLSGSRMSLGGDDDGVEGGIGERIRHVPWGGPGGEVVQELKDVIWKVGEKRRRMSELVAGVAQVVPPPSGLALGAPPCPPLPVPPSAVSGEVGGLQELFPRVRRVSLPPLPSILDAFEPPEGTEVFEVSS